MELWISRIELGLLVVALTRLQFLAVRCGKGSIYATFSLLMFFGGVIFLISLPHDHLGQLGQMLFAAALGGIFQARPTSVEPLTDEAGLA